MEKAKAEINLTKEESQWLFDKATDEDDRARDCASFGEDEAAKRHKTRSLMFSEILRGEFFFSEEDPRGDEFCFDFDFEDATENGEDHLFESLPRMETFVAAVSALRDVKAERPGIFGKLFVAGGLAE